MLCSKESTFAVLERGIFKLCWWVDVLIGGMNSLASLFRVVSSQTFAGGE
jgi:hypothetical protein